MTRLLELHRFRSQQAVIESSCFRQNNIGHCQLASTNPEPSASQGGRILFLAIATSVKQLAIILHSVTIETKKLAGLTPHSRSTGGLQFSALQRKPWPFSPQSYSILGFIPSSSFEPFNAPCRDVTNLICRDY